MAKPFDRKIRCLGLVTGAQSSRDFELTETIFRKSRIAVRCTQDYMGKCKVRVALQCLVQFLHRRSKWCRKRGYVTCRKRGPRVVGIDVYCTLGKGEAIGYAALKLQCARDYTGCEGPRE